MWDHKNVGSGSPMCKKANNPNRQHSNRGEYGWQDCQVISDFGVHSFSGINPYNIWWKYFDISIIDEELNLKW